MAAVRSDDAIAQGPTLPSGPEATPAGRPEAEAAGGGGDRLAAGARAGDYEIERFIGAGAMGDVYAARHPLIGKRAAVKVLKRHLASSPDAVERFLREARAVNQVGHAHVVDVFAVGRLDDGRLYLVMDLLEGESLGARVRRGRLDADDALAILDDVAAALDAAHARGVVHRDLKPDNVFLARRDGERPAVFVLDFGIAKLLAPGDGDAAAVATLTDRGAWLGTPAYMAPEQWGADGAGPASDRYALGVMAFELLAGRAPFRAATLPQMMEQHFRAAVPSLAGTGAGGDGVGLPPAVDDVLARAMAKDPDARFASARELTAALRAALGTSGGARGRGAAATVARGRAGAPRRRPWAALALGGLVAAGAITTAALLIGGGGRAPASEPRPNAGQARGPRIDVTSVPSGARVAVGGVDRGATPTSLPVAEVASDDGAIELTLSRPGYVPVTVRVRPGDLTPVRASLTPVAQFEGVWALPDGALRAFERRGEQVAMFHLGAATGEREFARFFEFLPAGAGEVVFVATEEHVDPRGANEPSCHVPLQAEYRYDLTADALERRIERVRLDFAEAEGRCAVRSKAWGDAIALRRMATEAHAGDGTWVESSAGAGIPVAADVPGTDEKDGPNAPDETGAKGAPDETGAKGAPDETGANATDGKKPPPPKPAARPPTAKKGPAAKARPSLDVSTTGNVTGGGTANELDGARDRQQDSDDASRAAQQKQSAERPRK